MKSLSNAPHREQIILKIILSIQLLSAFLFAAIFTNIFYIAFHTGLTGWPLSDYMINYSAGFVRRGLFGELIYNCSTPISCANTLHISALAIFGILFFLIVIKSNPSPWRIAAIFGMVFATGGLLDISQVDNSFNYWGRKEILFYTAMIILSVVAKMRSAYVFFTVASVLSIAVILTHELFFVFFVPIIAAAICIKAISVQAPRKLAIIYTALCSMAFGATIIYSGTDQISNAILENVRTISPDTPTGAIQAIGWSFEQSSGLSHRLLLHGQFEYWLFHFLFAILTIALIATLWAKDKISRTISLALVSWLFIATLIAAASGWDWGRWISIFTIGSILSLFLFDACKSEVMETSLHMKYEGFSLTSLTPLLSLIPLLLMQSLINIEHCCTQGNRITLSAPWVNMDWFELHNFWAETPNATTVLANESLALALRASELLNLASSTSDTDRAEELIANAALVMQLSLQKLSEAAASGLTGDEGDSVATVVERVWNEFRDAGVF